MVLVGARTTFPTRTNFFFYLKKKLNKNIFKKKLKKINSIKFTNLKNWAEILGGWSLPECFASSQVLLHPPSMSGRWHRHLMWSCEPHKNTLPCVWWGNPLTPYKHCHTGSAHPGRTEVIDLLSSTRQQAQAVTHRSTKRGQYCLTSWVIIYYMLHNIDKWNLYWSYTIKCIFAGTKISRFDPR